jgi:hypothetical protein
LDKPLHVIYKVRKLAYRIPVILIANERVKKILVRRAVTVEMFCRRRRVFLEKFRIAQMAKKLSGVWQQADYYFAHKIPAPFPEPRESF